MSSESSSSSGGVKRKRDSDKEELVVSTNRSVSNVWALTQTDQVEINFKWAIEDFSLKPSGNNDYIKSSKFFSSIDRCKWWIQLYPKRARASHQNVEHVSIYLCWIDGKSKTNSKIIRKAELTLLNADQQVLNHVILKPNAVAKTGPYFGSWQLKAHLQQQQIEAGSLLPSDTLHIHCKLVYESSRNTTKIQGSNSTVPFSKYVIPNGSLTHRFESLFDKDMSFTDLEIHAAGGVIFPAHKFVLAAGSPAFSAMLQSEGFAENKTNILEIDDLVPPVVKEMLRFLYTDRVEKMDQLAKDLLVAADKYLIDSLKSNCQLALAETLTVENCCQMLALADSHSAADLKNVAMKFTIRHLDELMKCESWRQLKRTHPHLGFQVVETMVCVCYATTDEEESSSDQ